MEKAKEYIKDGLRAMKKNNSSLEFKVEFSSLTSTFIVEVSPVRVYEKSKKYREEEFTFSCQFEDEFEDYLIMFVTQKSLIKVEKSLFEIPEKNILTETAYSSVLHSSFSSKKKNYNAYLSFFQKEFDFAKTFEANNIKQEPILA